MFETVAKVFAGKRGLGGGEAVEAVFDSLVAHGVHGDLEARTVGSEEHAVEFLLAVVEDAAVVGVGSVGVTGGSGWAAGGAVGDGLVGADHEAVVAEAGVDAGGDEGATRAAAGAVRAKGVDADLELSLGVQVLSLDERRADEAAGIVDAGASSLQIRVLAEEDAFAQLRAG